MFQVYYGFSLKYFPIGKKNRLIQSPTRSPYKNEIEWLKYECPSDIINFRCFLLKAYFRSFYFELETLLNKLVKLCDYFFRKIFLNKNAECLIFIKKVNLLTNRAFTENSNISMNFLYIDGLHLLYSGKELLAKNFYFNIFILIFYENTHSIQTYT